MATRYDRLMLAYPRWHRRLHGPDMLTALEDCAAAGRPVSTRRLVLDGIACRLRVRGPAAKLAAACVSVVAAAAMGACLSWVTWQVTDNPWPTVDEAAALAKPMLPPGMAEHITRRDRTLVTPPSMSDLVPSTLLGAPELEDGGVRLSYNWPPANGDGALTAIQRQAEAAGWQTVRNGYDLVARRDGMRVRVLCVPSHTIVAISPAAPAAAYWLGWIGAALGALLGWLAAAAAIARHRRLPPSIRSLPSVAGLVGVCMATPATLLNLAALVSGADSVYTAAPWIGYELFAVRPAAILGGAGLCLAWLITIIIKGDHVSAPAAG